MFIFVLPPWYITSKGRDTIGSRLSSLPLKVSHMVHIAHWPAETPNIWQSSPNSCWQRSAQWILLRHPATNDSLHLPVPKLLVILEYFCSWYKSVDIAITVFSQNTVINTICMMVDSGKNNEVIRNEFDKYEKKKIEFGFEWWLILRQHSGNVV